MERRGEEEGKETGSEEDGMKKEEVEINKTDGEGRKEWKGYERKEGGVRRKGRGRKLRKERRLCL